ncbi:M16 family metallopeptidase [Streptomyces bambusae]|uniref:Insulinase family protein n=1 Tax=Streptomyces bambusae TaxID=1550616 RepID=A0ABS6Z103_9ACTN|nr:insulinase family protein [Streptomyces bambusae]MBW5481422.1 insulinase family protein [Streptomyces bambusae]
MITETTVDGIRTVLAPASGPVTAGLLFRVGRADETLATSGITHLVEHLALYRHGTGDLHYNGATAAAYTHFHVQGTPADVVEYLNGVCAALRDLPMDRLETEKEILRTEAAGRGHGSGHRLPPWRYGAQSYGLTGYAEAGLPRLTAHAVRSWAEQWFTTENAVLWITGDTVPEGLDLTLPSGSARPAPAATSALPTTPAYFIGENGGVLLDAVVARSTPARLFASVLGKELFRELRQKGGWSYTAAADYCPRDADHATVTAVADALPEQQDAVVGGFIDVLAKLRAGRIEHADLKAVRASALAVLDTPDVEAGMLPGRALDLLMGHRALTAEESRAEIEAVTVEDLQRVAREVWDDALMQVPARGVEWAGLTAAPVKSEETAYGRRYGRVDAPDLKLIVGTDAISLSAPNGSVSTVRYADCVLMCSFPDGARHLTGPDGFVVEAEPALFGITAAELAPVDAAVPPAAVVPMPPRDPARIPRPNADRTPAKSPPGPARPPRSWALTVQIWCCFALTAMLALFSAAGTGIELDPVETPDGPDWSLLAVSWSVTAGMAALWIRALRARRRGEG